MADAELKGIRRGEELGGVEEGEGVDVFLGGSRVHLDEAGSVIAER